MADHIQQPDEAPGPAAALVVVDHIDRVGAMSQCAEQLLQLRDVGKQAGRWRLAELGLLGVDEASTRQMAFGIASSTGQIDQNQFRRIEASGQIGRLDHQRQVGKDGHGGPRLSHGRDEV